jgi:hypothetical protein
MESEEITKRARFIAELTSTGPRHEPEVEDASRAHKETRIAIPTPMLDVAFRDGSIRSFSYAHLTEVEFEPGDTLTLKFTSGAEVIAEGRGLARARQDLRHHRADEIHECSESELLLQGEGVSQIEKIYITEGEKA